MTVGGVATAGPAGAVVTPPHKPSRGNLGLAAAFLVPMLILLGALVVYPIVFTAVRSLFNATGSRFVGVRNYHDVFTSHQTLVAIRNNAIWVAIAPPVVTFAGLIFAVLTERISWATAFKTIVFMPMAISFVAAG